MRIEIAKAAKECEGAIAVVCGAWHVPALIGASQPRGRSRIAQGAAEGEDQGDLGAMDRAAAGALERLWRGRGRARLVRASVGDARRRRSRRGVACQGRVRAARSRTFRVDRLGDRGAAAGHRACGPSRPPLARLRGIARGRDRLPVRRRARGLERCRGRAFDRRRRRIDPRRHAARAAARGPAAPAEGDTAQARGAGARADARPAQRERADALDPACTG